MKAYYNTLSTTDTLNLHTSTFLEIFNTEGRNKLKNDGHVPVFALGHDKRGLK